MLLLNKVNLKDFTVNGSSAFPRGLKIMWAFVALR